MLMEFGHFKKNVILKTNSIAYRSHLFSMDGIKKNAARNSGCKQ